MEDKQLAQEVQNELANISAKELAHSKTYDAKILKEVQDTDLAIKKEQADLEKESIKEQEENDKLLKEIEAETAKAQKEREEALIKEEMLPEEPVIESEIDEKFILSMKEKDLIEYAATKGLTLEIQNRKKDNQEKLIQHLKK